ncbi:hypothetical protein [Bacillus fonticola]|uniref:hypothetical protein n=1 Tax=Bacillus fonticola TaxID=2728853 RepID=UPI0014742C2C|nr:hypothetical protein [Bacillus fonticola]
MPQEVEMNANETKWTSNLTFEWNRTTMVYHKVKREWGGHLFWSVKLEWNPSSVIVHELFIGTPMYVIAKFYAGELAGFIAYFSSTFASRHMEQTIRKHRSQLIPLSEFFA